MDEASYKRIERQLDFGEKSVDSILKAAKETGEWLSADTGLKLEIRDAKEARGSILRQLHAWLKEKDPSFGGLARVRNKRQEFLWVHPQFEKEY